MGCGCPKCNKMSGILFLVLGFLFLLVDLGTWAFWGIQWWTVLFLVMGLGKVAMGSCKDCQAMGKK